MLLPMAVRDSDGRSWGAWAKEDVALDPQRTHWMGALQTEAYHDVWPSVMCTST